MVARTPQVAQSNLLFDLAPQANRQDICWNVLRAFTARAGSEVGSALRYGAQGPGFKPGLFHKAQNVPSLSASWTV